MGENENTNILEQNSTLYNHASMLQIRLDVTEILERIELFMRGTRSSVQQEASGEFIVRKIKYGVEKASDEGVQDVLSFITSKVNTAVVQGNFKEEMYYSYIEEVNISLVKMLVINAPIYEIRDEDIEPICDFIMSLLIPFMSRLINNEERKSYSMLRQIESSSRTAEASRGFLGFLKGGKR